MIRYPAGMMSSFFMVVLIFLVAGCIEPPLESPASVTGSPSSPAKIVTTVATTSPHSYITLVTPVITPLETPDYHRFTSPTPLPEEKSCRIYTTTQTFMYNGSAFTFDLKNPPMYITYTVNPRNITGYDVYTSRYGSKPDVVATYNRYDPQSFLEITVSNKTSGEVYLKDGFGTEYTTYLNRTLKVLSPDDLLVEIKGNKVQATVNFWVKPVGNFDNPENMTFDSCTYWSVAPRDNTAVALVTATTTPSWTPP